MKQEHIRSMVEATIAEFEQAHPTAPRELFAWLREHTASMIRYGVEHERLFSKRRDGEAQGGPRAAQGYTDAHFERMAEQIVRDMVQQFPATAFSLVPWVRRRFEEAMRYGERIERDGGVSGLMYPDAEYAEAWNRAIAEHRVGWLQQQAGEPHPGHDLQPSPTAAKSDGSPKVEFVPARPELAGQPGVYDHSSGELVRPTAPERPMFLRVLGGTILVMYNTGREDGPSWPVCREGILLPSGLHPDRERALVLGSVLAKLSEMFGLGLEGPEDFRLTVLLLSVLRDNPDLARWLSAGG